MSSKADQSITGYKYSMSILMGLCRGPIEQIVQIKVGDMVAWTGPLIGPSTLVAIDQPQLFGGDEAEGGVVGSLDFYDGNSAQIIPARTVATIQDTNTVAVATSDGSTLIPLPPVDSNADSSSTNKAPVTGSPTIAISYTQETVPVPMFRGVATLFFDGAICSNNPYPKAWKVRGRRVLAGWDGDCWYPEAAVVPMQDAEALATAATDTANVQASAASDETGSGGYTTNTTPASTAILLPESGAIYAMNPAHILYEVITNRVWGRGLLRVLIDDASFTSAANWLLQEGFGLCLKWSKSDDLGTFVQHILDTIGATLFTSRLTGLLTLKLIRNDYNVSQLMTLDYNSGLLSVEESTNASPDTLLNEVIVKYHSPVSDTDRQVRCQDLASITTLDQVNSATREYPGIPTPDLALRCAQRDLASIAWGVRSFTLTCDRRAYKIQPGDCFNLVALDRGISSTVLRLIKIEDSTLTSGEIKLTCAQDVYGLPLTTFGTAQPTLYNPVNRNPEPVTYHRLVEMTYRDAYKRLTASDLASLSPGQSGFIDLAAKPTTLAAGYAMQVSANGGYLTNAGLKAFPLFVRLVNKIGSFATQLTLIGFPSNFSYSLPACLLIDDEFLRIDALDVYTGIATVARGCVDSLPQRHAAGAVAWFYDTGQTDSLEYAVGETITVYEQTRTSKGYLPLANAPGVSLVLVGRQERPYPPANVTINGPYALDSDSSQYTITAQDLTINFSRRNRITLADTMIGYSDADMTPESGQTTTVRIRRMSDGAVVGTYSGITGTQFIYTQKQALSDGAFGAIQVELYSQVGTTSSRWVYAYPLNYYPAAAVSSGSTGVETASLNLAAWSIGLAAATGSGASTIGFGALGLGRVAVSASSSTALAVRAPDAHGTTIGGFSLTSAFGLSSTQAGVAAATGNGFGRFAVYGSLGDIDAGSIGRFAFTGWQTASRQVAPGSFGFLALSAAQAGIAAATGKSAASLSLANGGQQGSVVATGTSSASFSLGSADVGQDAVAGVSNGRLSIASTETAQAVATGSSASATTLAAVQSGTAPATGVSISSFALASADTGRDGVAGASAGSLTLASVETGIAAATGTEAASLTLASAETGIAAATGTETAALAFSNGGEAGQAFATGSQSASLTLASAGAGVVPDSGNSTATIAMSAVQSSSMIASMQQTAALALGNGGETGQVTVTGNSNAVLALASADMGQDTAGGTSTGNLTLASVETGIAASTGTETASFAFGNGGETGIAAATGTETASLTLANGGATGQAAAMGSSTATVKVASAETGQAAATGTSTATLALSASDSGSDAATGTSTGNLTLGNGGAAGIAAATGTETASLTLGNGGETGQAAATGSQTAALTLGNGGATGQAPATGSEAASLTLGNGGESAQAVATGSASVRLTLGNGGATGTVTATGTETASLALSNGGQTETAGYGSNYGINYGTGY